VTPGEFSESETDVTIVPSIGNTGTPPRANIETTAVAVATPSVLRRPDTATLAIAMGLAALEVVTPDVVAEAVLDAVATASVSTSPVVLTETVDAAVAVPNVVTMLKVETFAVASEFAAPN